MSIMKNDFIFYKFNNDIYEFNTLKINCSSRPEESHYGKMEDIISADATEEIYISPVACHGILRRVDSRNSKLDARLREILVNICSTMSMEEIERRSRRQPRGSESGMARRTRINKI